MKPTVSGMPYAPSGSNRNERRGEVFKNNKLLKPNKYTFNDQNLHNSLYGRRKSYPSFAAVGRYYASYNVFLITAPVKNKGY
jgi:hypothetical protein